MGLMGASFADEREAIGLSAAAFARISGVNVATVRGWERPRRAGGNIQQVPPWAWLLVRTWQEFPGSLSMARAGAGSREASHSQDRPGHRAQADGPLHQR